MGVSMGCINANDWDELIGNHQLVLDCEPRYFAAPRPDSYPQPIPTVIAQRPDIFGGR
jgi:hypothetical protein